MSKRNQDNHNRFRSKTIAFRVSPEEDKQLNIAVSLTGMTKQDFIISKLLDRTINVQANCKVHRAVFDRLSEVLEELHRLESSNDIDDELMDNIALILAVANGLYYPKEETLNLMATGIDAVCLVKLNIGYETDFESI